jgi:DNA-directed RNA polymerase II subunit RPB3
MEDSDEVRATLELRRRPKIEITSLTGDTIQFTLSDSDASVANALRRVMIAEVPTLAIESVQFLNNTSHLCEEYIAHRLGLIPLRSTEIKMEDFTPKNQCCQYHQGCEHCTIEFELNQTCPSTQDVFYVTSQHLAVQGSRHERVQPAHFASEDESRVLRSSNGIRIVALGKGQNLHLTAKAHKSVGKEHAKWNPVCVATYRYEPVIEVDTLKLDLLSPEHVDKLIASCPAKVFEGASSGYGRFTVANKDKCMFCQECVKTGTTIMEEITRRKNDTDKLIKVSHNPGVFHFTVESTGALAPEDIVMDAFEVILKKLAYVEDALFSNDNMKGGMMGGVMGSAATGFMGGMGAFGTGTVEFR